MTTVQQATSIDSSRALQLFAQRTLSKAFYPIYQFIKESETFSALFSKYVFQTPENPHLLRDINAFLMTTRRLEIETKLSFRATLSKIHHLFNHPDVYTAAELEQRPQVSLLAFQAMMQASLDAIQVNHESLHEIQIPGYIAFDAVVPHQAPPFSIDDLGNLNNKPVALDWLQQFTQDPNFRDPIPVEYVWDLVAHAHNTSNVALLKLCAAFIRKSDAGFSVTPEVLVELWHYATAKRMGWLQWEILQTASSHEYKLIIYRDCGRYKCPSSQPAVDLLHKLHTLGRDPIISGAVAARDLELHATIYAPDRLDFNFKFSDFHFTSVKAQS